MNEIFFQVLLGSYRCLSSLGSSLFFSRHILSEDTNKASCFQTDWPSVKYVASSGKAGALWSMRKCHHFMTQRLQPEIAQSLDAAAHQSFTSDMALCF
jgi:hypothetical protein